MIVAEGWTRGGMVATANGLTITAGGLKLQLVGTTLVQAHLSVSPGLQTNKLLVTSKHDPKKTGAMFNTGIIIITINLYKPFFTTT